jgi:hypothetical protein
MEILTRLLFDVSLFLALAFSTFTIDFIFISLFGGMLKLKSLSFGISLNKPLYYNFYSILAFGSVLIFLVSPLLLISYLFSRLFYSLNCFLDLYDIASTSLAFFVFMLLYMGCDHILLNIEMMNNDKESECYTKILWEEIDLSLTPAIIHTSLVVLGMLVTYYQFKT